MTDVRKIVCPHCDTVNRVPQERPALAARCGRCRRPLFAGAPVALDAARLRKHLANSDLPLIVDFWAAWCGPCRVMAPIFEKAAAALEPRARFVKVDADAEPALAAEFGVQSIPTLFAFSGGKVVRRHSGVLDLRSLQEWVGSASG